MIAMAFQSTYYIKNGDWSYEEFSSAIKNISSAQSVTGINYTGLSVEDEKIIGVRESTNVPFSISLKRLYDAFCEVKVFTTGSLKPYVDRVQSPSLAILIACGAIVKADESQTVTIQEERKTSAAVTSGNSDAGSWLKKFFLAFLIGGALILCGKFCSEDTVSNGHLTEAAHEQAVIAIKSQISDPSSYKGGSWDEAIWDSNSTTKRYVLKHNFTQTNSWGEQVRSIAFIYFDVDGKPTDIEIMQ